MTDKQIVMEAIRALPPDASLEEIRARIELLIGLREAERSVDRGETVPHEEVEREFAAWVKAWRTQSSGQNSPSGT